MMLKSDKEITITIPEDSRLLLAFQKHREKFIVLLKSGLFDLQSGKAEINVNNKQIQSVHIHQLTYKRETNDNIPI